MYHLLQILPVKLLPKTACPYKKERVLAVSVEDLFSYNYIVLEIGWSVWSYEQKRAV